MIILFTNSKRIDNVFFFLISHVPKSQSLISGPCNYIVAISILRNVNHSWGMTSQLSDFLQTLRIPHIDFIFGKSMCGHDFVILLCKYQIAYLWSSVPFGNNIIFLYVKHSQTFIRWPAPSCNYIWPLLRPVKCLYGSFVLLFKKRGLHFHTKNKKLIIISATCKIVSVGAEF